MTKQISLAIPDPLYKAMQQRAKRKGYRSVQECLLQMARDEFFLKNLPRYRKIAKGLKRGKGQR